MKYRHVIWIVVLVLIVDQALKFWIKTHMNFNQEFIIFPNWFRIHFTENPGMAYGLELGGEWGKVLLTLFRLAAVVIGFKYMKTLVKQQHHTGLLICGALILAGAAGNLIDSMFYGMVFDKGFHYDPVINDYVSYSGVAHFSSDGYSSFLHGSVVDMLYFPLFDGKFPSWFPFVGGKEFEFFSAIFNISDASISVGVITLLFFQKRFFRKQSKTEEQPTIETSTDVSDKVQVS